MSTAPSLFTRPATVESMTAVHRDTAVERMGIEFTQVGPDRLVARMPVDARTKQPAGILHGGVSMVLAETLGSCAATLCLAPGRQAVGLDINANHIRAVREGWVIGTCTPIHVGRSTHVWAIEIRDEAGRLVCTSRITMAILDAQSPG
jgi:1,4-dihydroxy-2-naphthoyl-CoA hydrolase